MKSHLDQSRERRNSTSSQSSTSPFLTNSFKNGSSHGGGSSRSNGGDIPLQELRSVKSSDHGEDDDYKEPNRSWYHKLYRRLRNKDNFIGKSRIIHINNQENNKPYKYHDNYVQTSKYSIITFLPKNLFEQFCRLANFYFLMISALQLIPGVSPTGKYTTLGPLLVVLAITALKEAYEDIKRHKQDDKVNYSKIDVLREGAFTTINWRDVMVGDIVRVTNRQYIPADLLLLSSSEPQASCYIETANLDGETNLKLKQALDETSALSNDINRLSGFSGYVECEHPNKRLYTFVGSLYPVGGVGGDSRGLPISTRQILLRGAMLRNTKWITGMVIYTGRDTKLMRNSKATPHKRSEVEKMTNQFIIIIFFLQILLCASCAIANGFWDSENQVDWYLMWTRSPSEEGALSFLTFLILFNNLIPISLYVSMEFVKVFQAYFINNDLEMYYKENDTPALARTSNLNEELGQIEYIFSDKTGTLTQNKMEFKRCSIGGIPYGLGGMTEATMGRLLREGKSLSDLNLQVPQQQRQDVENRPNPLASSSSSSSPSSSSTNNNTNNGTAVNRGGSFYDEKLFSNMSSNNNNNVSQEQSKVTREFFNVLAVCHTVIPEKEDGVTIYQASSPDEGALVNAAKDVGFIFKERTNKTVTITIPNFNQPNLAAVGSQQQQQPPQSTIEQTFEVLNILEFNSDRKRMSVVVKTPDGRLLLYCKGADTVIFERLAPRQPYADKTITHLQEFATEGLRTLCIAYCEIDPQFYEKWSQEYYVASNSMVNRDGEIAKVAESIERNLFLLGATAIEDKLQEGVPDTISILRRAGIKIWVLTGDKQETAINIGFSCQLLSQKMELIVINEQSVENTIIELNRRIDEIHSPNSDIDKNNLALIIDGTTLTFALEASCRVLLLQLAQMCRVVVCCRVSPSQKADMVSLIRDNLNAITLAIGDGANDVSMIQAAHVGIGISGEEGLQAARSSDYAIAQFRFLSRLLLIHGRYSYRRISKLICYCFYKNITLYITQFWFTVMNGWSGQTFYERFTLTAYNVAWSFLPVIVMGIFDKDVDERFVMEHPQLYKTGTSKLYFNIKVFWGWVTNGIFHSFILFIFPMLIFQHGLAFTSGRAIDLFQVGTIAYSCVVITVNLKLALETRYWTWINHLALWGSIVLYFIWLLVFGKFWEFESLDVGSDLYEVIYRIGRSSLFYFTIALIPFLCLWRDLSWKVILRNVKPKSYHIVQEISHKSKKSKSPLSGSGAGADINHKSYTGYSFSQEPGQADVLSKKYQN